MNYVGVDVHKKYSVLCALDEGGHKLREARVEGNASRGFAQFFASLEGPSKAVVEACWNWGLIHDELEEIEQVEEVVLAHPYKTRLIADAQIKTDRLDAHAVKSVLVRSIWQIRDHSSLGGRCLGGLAEVLTFCTFRRHFVAQRHAAMLRGYRLFGMIEDLQHIPGPFAEIGPDLQR